MNDQMKILRNLSNKYASSFKYTYQKSHKLYLNNVMLFSLDDKNINILSVTKYPDRLDYERDLLEKIIFPASQKYTELNLDEYEKKCLFVLAFSYMLYEVLIKGA